ncbi:MAG: hypothetical protein ACU0BF_00160 [Paracoccaceae bacterium]
MIEFLSSLTPIAWIALALIPFGLWWVVDKLAALWRAPWTDRDGAAGKDDPDA